MKSEKAKGVKTDSTQQRMKNKVFQIRLRSNQEAKLNENFVGVIEQEFATKYLESLGIEPTQKNIGMILRSYPLKKCQISAGWNNTGLLADTLTIVARKDALTDAKTGDQDKKAEKTKSFFSNEFADEIRKVGLKTINVDALYKNIQKSLEPSGKQRHDDGELRDDDEGVKTAVPYNEKRLFQMDFNLDNIKRKYLYPFNISKEKRKAELERGRRKKPSNDAGLLEGGEFEFPFEQVNVNVALIKELQQPLNVTYELIKIQIDKFCNDFPFHEIFPARKIPPNASGGDKEKVEEQSDEEENQYVKAIQFLKQVLKGETNVRFIGLNAHYCYWSVFGHTSPFELDHLFKKQILITLFEVLDNLRDGVPSQPLWANFYFPFILLALRMLIEYVFRTTYTTFFSKGEFAEIALDRMNCLITKIYDPNNFFSRLVYLESEIKAVRKRNDEHVDETKMIKKRLLGVSPFMDMVLPRPAEGRVRSLFSIRKKHDGIDIVSKGKGDTTTGKPDADELRDDPEGKAKLGKVYDMRLLSVMLNRINTNLVQKGVKTNIVSLPKVNP